MESKAKLKSDSLPRKPSAVWVAMKTVKTKLSLTDEGATPVNWKVVFLVFLSLGKIIMNMISLFWVCLFQSAVIVKCFMLPSRWEAYSLPIVCLSFSSSFNITFIFPFLPEMIKTFGYKEEEKGFYAGIVASALFVGRAFGSYFWGWLSDKKGRRPIVLLTLLLNGVFCLCFGFTTSIYFAFFIRVLAGLANGTVGTAKTILYEISDNSNQAVGMSIISIAWGSGLIMGPAVGGYLANPCKLYPDVFPSEGFLLQFPYFFPGLIAFVICLIAFAVDFIWLPETLSSKTTSEEVLEDDNEFGDEKTSLHSCHDVHHGSPPSATPSYLRVNRPKAALSVENLHVESEGATYLAGSRKEIHITKHGITFTDNPEEARILKEDSNKCNNSYKGQFYIESESKQLSSSTGDVSNEKITNGHKCVIQDGDDAQATLLKKVDEAEDIERSDGEHPEKKDTGCCYRIKNWSLIKLIRQYEVFLAVFMYATFSFSVIGVEEIFTVWSSTDVTLDGLGFEPQEIGTVLGITSLPLLFLQLFVFPNMVRRIGIKKTLLLCSTILVILTDALPVMHLLVNRPMALWASLLSVYTLMKLMISCTFSCTGLMINNSVTPDLAASVNGLAMTVTAITRSFAPIIGGSIFSWVVGYASENIGPPFDVSLVFFVFGIIYWVVAVVGVFVPDSLNKQKK